MKKRIGLILISLLLILMASGCSNENLSQASIKPAELNETEKNILDLVTIKDGTNIFDFKLPKKAKSLNMVVYKLENGKWTEKIYQEFNDFSADEGRIALSFDKLPDGVTCSIQAEDFSNSLSINPTVKQNFSRLTFITSVLDQEEKVEMNKDVPVAIQVASSKDNISTFSVQEFFNPEVYEKAGHDHVYALCLQFLDGGEEDTSMDEESENPDQEENQEEDQ